MLKNITFAITRAPEVLVIANSKKKLMVKNKNNKPYLCTSQLKL